MPEDAAMYTLFLMHTVKVKLTSPIESFAPEQKTDHARLSWPFCGGIIGLVYVTDDLSTIYGDRPSLLEEMRGDKGKSVRINPKSKLANSQHSHFQFDTWKTVSYALLAYSAIEPVRASQCTTTLPRLWYLLTYLCNWFLFKSDRAQLLTFVSLCNEGQAVPVNQKHASGLGQLP